MAEGGNLPGYMGWAAGVTALIALGTYLCLMLWDRHVRRETSETLRLVLGKEAAARLAAHEAAVSAERHRALAEASAIVFWRALPDGGMVDMEGWTALTGQPGPDALGHGWLAMLHPEDHARAEAAWAASLEKGRPLDVEYRTRTVAGAWRWCRSRAVPIGADLATGRAEEWVGVLEDVDDRRQAEEHRLLVAREVDHRAKNVLAVVQTIVRLSTADTVEAYAETVWSRIGALARAHELLAEHGWAGADLREVAEREMVAYGESREGGRVLIDGPARPIAPLAVQPLAMVLHEMATNAAKGGALSAPQGRISLRWWVEGELLRLRWVESGGPAVSGPPRRAGFGTRLIDATVQGQLGGTLCRHWGAGGLEIELALPLARVSPPLRD